MRGAQLPIHHFTRIDSTNEEARRLFKKGHGEACWIIADEQTAGRGRRGRRWESETGNFAATLYMPGPISVASAGHMSFVTGLAIHDCLADLTSAELHVKWPNDLLLDGCKLSGMLLEAFKITDGNVLGLAIGIGINLAHHPENMPYPATHLALHRSSRIIKNHDSSERMGENHDPLAPLNILKALSVCFATRLHDYHQNGFAPCRAAWLERAFGIGTVIQVNLEAEQMLGVFEGLDDAGQLLLRQDDGTTHKITAGDIFLRVLAMANRPNLVFVPLGGTGEIGMNCNLYGYSSGDARRDKDLSHRDWLMIDLGITFGRHHVPGIDVITPDLSFIEQRRASLKGLILTHGHEDHIGAVALLWPRLQCPIYTTAFTAELVRGKLAEHGLLDTVPLHVMEMNADLDLDPFQLQFIGLTHSIAEMQSVVIRCGETTVLHTGDWKFDEAPVIGAASDLSALSDLGEAGVDAIICNSTNVLQSGRAGSEADVGEALTELVKTCPGRVVVTTFASNVARLASVGAAALATDRQVVLSGRGMHRIFEAARATGYLENFPSCVPEQEAGYLPPENTLILCTGSQGEHRAALRRMADGSHPHITLGPSDTVIFSSKMIPGNEVDILELHNDLVRAGVQVLTAQGGDFHVSGHPCRDELIDMYQRVRPRLAIPVHGEARHLDAHARLARELGVDHALVIENGDVVCLDPDDARVMGHVPVGRIHMDGHLAVPEDASAASVRRKLSHVGVVSIGLAMDAGGRLCGAPEISLAGLPHHDEDGILMEDWVREAIDLAVPENGRVTQGRIEQDISRQVRRLCVQRWGKKPVIHVLLVAT